VVRLPAGAEVPRQRSVFRMEIHAPRKGVTDAEPIENRSAAGCPSDERKKRRARVAFPPEQNPLRRATPRTDDTPQAFLRLPKDGASVRDVVCSSAPRVPEGKFVLPVKPITRINAELRAAAVETNRARGIEKESWVP